MPNFHASLDEALLRRYGEVPIPSECRPDRRFDLIKYTIERAARYYAASGHDNMKFEDGLKLLQDIVSILENEIA
jgi:hypothetical protein